MTKLEEQLEKIKNSKKIGLMTHAVIGYPTIADTVRTVKAMSQAGADIIELQIPFSDPIADGPTIMRACEESLRNGTRVSDALTLMQSLSKSTPVPLLFMAYYNTVFKYGTQRFLRDAEKAGAAGLIVADMPVDEEPAEHYLAYCRKYNLHNIQVLSPASTDERLKINARVASGFVYCTARQGTTGVKDKLDTGLGAYLKKIRTYFSVPIAVGFGISKKEHIAGLENNADIVIVGSAVIDIINRSNAQNLEKNIILFLNALSAG
jgi:tryptophan synthase alpha subunit